MKKFDKKIDEAIMRLDETILQFVCVSILIVPIIMMLVIHYRDF